MSEDRPNAYTGETIKLKEQEPKDKPRRRILRRLLYDAKDVALAGVVGTVGHEITQATGNIIYFAVGALGATYCTWRIISGKNSESNPF